MWGEICGVFVPAAFEFLRMLSDGDHLGKPIVCEKTSPEYISSKRAESSPEGGDVSLFPDAITLPCVPSENRMPQQTTQQTKITAQRWMPFTGSATR